MPGPRAHRGRRGLPEIRQLARDGKSTWSPRAYKKADMRDTRLVIAATDDPTPEAESRGRSGPGVWVNVVDVPPLLRFYRTGYRQPR